jgi:hypothetical protein
MPWLIAADSGKPIERAIVIDPLERYAPVMQRLWNSTEGFSTVAEWKQTLSENYFYDQEADVVLFCHVLFRLPRHQRRLVLERAWNALAPGGLLLVNETVTNLTAEPASGPDLIEITRLVEYMTWNEAPKLYRMETGWSEAENPLTRPAVEYGSSSIVVAKKPMTVGKPEGRGASVAGKPTRFDA